MYKVTALIIHFHTILGKIAVHFSGVGGCPSKLQNLVYDVSSIESAVLHAGALFARLYSPMDGTCCEAMPC